MTEVRQVPLTEELFRETYGFKEIQRPPIIKIIAQELKCTKETLLNFFPIAKWLPKYKWKDLLNDMITGITVAIMHIPHGLAYATLGKAEPVVGFYMAIFPVFIYIFFGTSRQISLGTFAVVCAMVGEVVQKQQNFELLQLQHSENWHISNSTTETPIKHLRTIEIGTAVCFFVGVFQVLLGFFKLGFFIRMIMTDSLVSGFTTGAACHVVSYQLKNLLGTPIIEPTGYLKLAYLYFDLLDKIESVNFVTMTFSISTIIILFVFNEYFKPALKKRFPKNVIPLPTEFIVIVTTILLSHFCHLSNDYHVKTVEYIPTGLPHPNLPKFSLFTTVIVDSLLIALVAVAINLSLAKIFAKKANYTVSDNQELLAYGFSNIFASFFSCLPSAASLSRSLIQFSVGGQTQFVSLFSLLLIICILLVAGDLFEPLPFCVLSAIVVVTLKGQICQICDFREIWKKNYWDGIVWMGTFLTVLLIDPIVGLGCGVLLCLFSLLHSSFTIKVNVLGRIINTKILLNVDHYDSARAHSNILTLQIVGNINFANSFLLEKKLTKNLQKFFDSFVDQEQMYVILNMNSTVEIDPTGVTVLKNFYKQILNSKCDLYITDCNVDVFKVFEICDFFLTFPKEQVLARTEDAIDYLSNLT